MEKIKIFEAELKFMNIIWNHEPVTTGELVKLCQEELDWKKSTTYTVLRRLVQRGAIRNENSVVKSLVSRSEVQKQESREHIEKIYNGSLSNFFVSFLQNEKLSEEELKELRKIIENGGGKNAGRTV
ncbi:MAG: BlaI/MecI/CopY family transcriptional regulator [Desulfitobacteriia bacterium]|jgi:BlaI family penicillinase repressor